MKWACKLGISEPVAHVVNRLVDYGSFSTYFMSEGVDDGGAITGHDEDDGTPPEVHEHVMLKFMHRKDPSRLEYVKAYYVHLMLDHLKETRHPDLGDALVEFKDHKVPLCIKTRDGAVISFENIVNEIMSFFRDNEREIMSDIHGL